MKEANKFKENKGKIIAAVIAVVVLIWGVSIDNQMKRFENRIGAIDLDMQSVHASIFQQMKQQGVAVNKYGSMVIEALEATFGENGSQAAFQWLQNQGTIPPSVMDKLGSAIEAGYNRFDAVQRTKIDTVRSYQDFAVTFPKNIVASVRGYPTKSWDELYKIVTSAQTKADFASGELSDPGIFE
ncbi:hypothetical protein HOF65_03910 [bacterium]|jgi:hypothetical protein|nr:hypothetical protein [bacterium]MBT3853115.1 hypothetical protein [bacterium]MBT6778522.1 hypothetical protein [bacterium]